MADLMQKRSVAHEILGVAGHAQARGTRGDGIKHRSVYDRDSWILPDAATSHAPTFNSKGCGPAIRPA